VHQVGHLPEVMK